MHILTKEEFIANREEYFQKILDGAVFIYPTDTIYGIGCNALIPKAVERIRKLKQREDQPFSVIIPSIDWIYDHCKVLPDSEEYINKLPGPYTLLFKLTDQKALAKEVNPKMKGVGVRIPNHWFTKVAAFLNIPIVTTSANVSGDNYMTTIEDLDDRIKNHVDFIIYEGEKHGKPSKIINLIDEGAKVIRD